ncbi:MAG: hypothetical protein IJU27_04550 [Bacteroidales bacterium]|nr:hypothetical protein [Bacteroidales bacterium]
MKILDRIKSREPCVESGWDAFDFLVDAPIDEAFILSLRPLGSFSYMKALKRPFFKIESHHYIIKGLQGDSFFRVAVHRDHMDELQMITGYITGQT